MAPRPGSRARRALSSFAVKNQNTPPLAGSVLRESGRGGGSDREGVMSLKGLTLPVNIRADKNGMWRWGAEVTEPCSCGAKQDGWGGDDAWEADIPGAGQMQAGSGTMAREERGKGPRGPEVWSPEAEQGCWGGQVRNTDDG